MPGPYCRQAALAANPQRKSLLPNPRWFFLVALLTMSLALVAVAQAQDEPQENPDIANVANGLSNDFIPGDPLHRTFSQLFADTQKFAVAAAAAVASGAVGPEPQLSVASIAPPGSALWQTEMQAHNDWVAQINAYQASGGQPPASESTTPAPAGEAANGATVSTTSSDEDMQTEPGAGASQSEATETPVS